ncbi:nonribosomal peptide synthetase 12 [Stemphylium lycopersici]|nr:nonribosomal peptide synthetase 12 [Stemphylium lycopersici]
MSPSFEHTENPTSSSESLNHPVASDSEDEHVDSSNGIAQQHPHKDTADSPDNFPRPNTAESSQESTKSVCMQPSQVHLVEANTPPRTDEPFDEKAIGGKLGLTVTTYGVSSEPETKVKPNRSQRIQRLFLHWCTAYRILIGLTFAMNAVVLAVLVDRNLFYERVSLSGPLIATAANIFAAVVVRQEDVINVSFALVAKTPASLPLWLRKIIADTHHYGGFHIGCSMSALLWYCFFVYLNTSYFIEAANSGTASNWMWADIITCYAFLLAIFTVSATAHPRLRVKFHNAFEHIHRFGGWTALVVLWINAGVSSNTQGSAPMYANAAVWLLAGITFLIILPWTRIRRVPITATLVSRREVKLSFPYAAMPYTSTARFSRSPLLEWHAFATIPNADGASAYVVISQAGDWTKAMITNPPSHLWVRRPAAANFLAFTPLFHSVLLVATGAGIGPLLSLLCSPAIARMRAQGRTVKVMWCVYAPEEEHWRFVQDIIRNVDVEPRIFDSRDGRPDMAVESAAMMLEMGLEAVMVVSNPKVTREVVEEVKGRGGAAYGAVFDS